MPVGRKKLTAYNLFSRSTFALLAAGAFTLAACSKVEPARPDFRAALDAHLAAIAARDLDGFKATITNGDDLVVIFPNGAALTTTAEVVGFHEEWFADADWVWEPAVVNIIEGADMTMALLKYDYRDSAEGEPRSSWLALVFKLEGGEWRLVHDQNTSIDPQTETE